MVEVVKKGPMSYFQPLVVTLSDLLTKKRKRRVFNPNKHVQPIGISLLGFRLYEDLDFENLVVLL